MVSREPRLVVVSQVAASQTGRSDQTRRSDVGEAGLVAETDTVPGARRSRRGIEDVSTEELLRRHSRKPSQQIRDAVVERHRPDVEAMARSMAGRLPRSVDANDLVHAGLWGLIQAIEKFRPERGVAFRPFMRPRVRGAMLDELRNLDFLPRLFRRRIRERDAALGRLRLELSREPSDAELASALGISESRLRSGYRAPAFDDRPRIEVGSRGVEGDWIDDLPDEELDDPIEALERQDLIERIEECLQPIEWTVLRMHYLEGLSGKEVAQRLKLSAARICQIHLRVLSRLKARLGAPRAETS